MKKGQKLTRNGHQLIGFPMEYMNITQGNNGQYSHQGVNALDLAGKDAGIDETIAPVDMDYKWHDSYTNGNAIFFQSSEPVEFTDGTVDYATFMFIHDNYIGDILAHGSHFVQGESFGDEGTAGRATGNHVDFEVAKGKYTVPYQLHSTGVYSLPNSISADQACVTDGTVIIDGDGMNWKTSNQLGKTTDDSKSVTITKDRQKKGNNRMVCLFQITDSTKYKGVVFYFDGSDVIKLTHSDQMKVLKDIYKENYGKDMPFFKWTTKAPYYNRLLQVSNEKAIKSL